MNDFDVVISVGTKDCFIVKKTIKYLNIHVCPQQIYLISDKRNSLFFTDRFLKDNNATLLDEDKLMDGLNFNRVKKLVDTHYDYKFKMGGWYFQQFLKIAFSLSTYAKEKYLIWDADTIPLRQLHFIDNGQMFITAKTEYHKPYFNTMSRLINLNKEVDFSYISEHMLIITSIMKNLVLAIENSSISGNNWYIKIINSVEKSEPNGFSEFETYGTFSHINYPNLYTKKELFTFRDAGKKYGRFVTDLQLKKLSIMYDMASFEFMHAPPFPKSLYHNLAKLFVFFVQKKRCIINKDIV